MDFPNDQIYFEKSKKYFPNGKTRRRRITQLFERQGFGDAGCSGKIRDVPTKFELSLEKTGT
jgi:hypothetical protein